MADDLSVPRPTEPGMYWFRGTTRHQTTTFVCQVLVQWAGPETGRYLTLHNGHAYIYPERDQWRGELVRARPPEGWEDPFGRP